MTYLELKRTSAIMLVMFGGAVALAIVPELVFEVLYAMER